MGERQALGKGLGALLGDRTAPARSLDSVSAAPRSTPAPVPPASDAGAQPVRMLALTAIQPNPDQPRQQFDEDALDELAASIETDGILQPIIVRAAGDAFVLIAGERRWRAAHRAGLTQIPALVHTLADATDSLRLALVENIQRQDLNPVEEAHAYRELIERCGLTQDELAHQVSRSRTAVTNALRLLHLPQQILALLASGQLTMGHARALLAADRRETQLSLAQRVVAEGLSVRQVEQMLSGGKPGPKRAPRKGSPPAQQDANLASLESALSSALGTKVTVHPTGDTSGHINIEYYTLQDFEGVLERLGLRGAGW